MEMPKELEAAATKEIVPCVLLALYARGGLMYSKGGSDETRQGIVEAFEDYARRWGEHLRWFAEAETERFRKFDAKVAGYPRRKLVRDDKGRASDALWVAYGGPDRHGATPWKFQGCMRNSYYARIGDLDYGAATWDVRAIHPNYGVILEVALAWARSFSVLYGCAGLTFNLPEDDEQDYLKRTYDLAMRFQGFELHDPTGTSLRCRQKVKSVNWLTIVAEELLAPIGGVAALRAQLSQEIELHAVRAGVLIQAGPEPLAGDVNRGETLPLYREVARALKPIRTDEKHLYHSLAVPQWWTRFDD